MEEKIFLSLGVQEYSSILVFSPPEHHTQEIAHMDLPKGASVSYVGDGMFDVILIFARNQRDVSELAAAGVAVLKKTGFLWFAYPSPKSHLATDISATEGWDTLFDAGWSQEDSFDLDNNWIAVKFGENI
ncbi:MAG TPA: hypothetical protein EYN92_01445 [Dehalococcoidia bacterium]|jgi:hypothetical protein|nr:hypothetical protein [Dehalococcoidia bacterium]